MKQRPNWGTLYVRRRKDGQAPPGTFREVLPEPPVDVEAEVERLAKLRREREERMRAILDAVDDT